MYRLLGAGTIEELVYSRQLYKQQQSNLAVHGTRERRFFEGIQGVKGQEGELFGLINLLAFDGSSKNTAVTANLAEEQAYHNDTSAQKHASASDDPESKPSGNVGCVRYEIVSIDTSQLQHLGGQADGGSGLTSNEVSGQQCHTEDLVQGLGNIDDGPLSDIIGLGLEAPLSPATTALRSRRFGEGSTDNVRIKAEGPVNPIGMKADGHPGGGRGRGGGGRENVKEEHGSTRVGDDLVLSRGEAQEALGQLSEAGVIRLVGWSVGWLVGLLVDISLN